MQLTRIDRWLLEEFVHETHFYTLSPPASLPRGIREVPLPENPSRRYQHHFIAANVKAANAFVFLLKENSQMFSPRSWTATHGMSPTSHPAGNPSPGASYGPFSSRSAPSP